MPAKLSPEQLDRALQLQRQCWTQERIAAELGVCPKTVYRHLSTYNRKVMARLERRGAATRARQVGQLEWMADEAARAWERSKRDAETVKVTTEGPTTRTETTLKGRDGDPGYLSEARAALSDVRKVLGLDASHDLARRQLDATLDQAGTPAVADAVKEMEDAGERHDHEQGQGEGIDREGAGEVPP